MSPAVGILLGTAKNGSQTKSYSKPLDLWILTIFTNWRSLSKRI